MLPDIRAVVSAIVAAVGLLMIAFGAVAALRVAQDSHGALQADLATRGQAVPPRSGQRPVVIDTPGPHIAPPPPLPVVEVKDAPIAAIADLPEPEPPPPAVVREAVPPAADAIGGPLAEPKPEQSETSRADELARKRAAANTAKKAREARIARQRKAAAAKRVARAKQPQAEPAAPPANGFGASNFGGTFGGSFKQ